MVFKKVNLWIRRNFCDLEKEVKDIPKNNFTKVESVNDLIGVLSTLPDDVKNHEIDYLNLQLNKYNNFLHDEITLEKPYEHENESFVPHIKYVKRQIVEDKESEKCPVKIDVDGKVTYFGLWYKDKDGYNRWSEWEDESWQEWKTVSRHL